MPSKIKKRSKGYLLTVVYQQKEYTKTVHVDTKAEAEKEWTFFANEVYNERVVAKCDGNMPLDSFYLYWYKNHAEVHLEVNTLAITNSVYQRISAALGHLKLFAIKPRHIMEFQKQLSSPTASVNNTPLSTAYIKRHFEVLNTLMQFAVDLGFISTNPVAKIKQPKRKATQKELPTEKHLAIFIRELDDYPQTKPRLWVLLAFTLGLRREEIFGLKWRDISFDRKTISISRAVVYAPGAGTVVKNTKTENSIRTIPMHDTVRTALLTWQQEVIAAHKKRNARNKVVSLENPVHPDRFIFTQPNGAVAHPHSFNTFLRKFCAKIGIPLISPHALRHMYGSYLLAGGVNLATISSLMGHSNKAFTLSTYVHEIESLEQHTAVVMDNAMQSLKKI